MTDSKIRELGKDPDGKPIRGIEVDYETTREEWAVYTTSTGDVLKVTNPAVEIYRLVDEQGNPIFDPNHNPRYFVNSAMTITARSGESSYDMMLASEDVLRRDWDTPEEDEVWADL